jgi:hypothetical protein
VVFFALHFFCSRKQKLRLFLRIGFLVTVDLFLKSLVQENRPFWELNVSVPLLICKNSFGFPDTSNFLFFILFINKAWNRYVIFLLGRSYDLVTDY